MKKLYHGYYWANGTAYISARFIFKNLRKAKKTMRAICKGNVYERNSGRWSIYEVIDGKEADKPIADGIVRR